MCQDVWPIALQSLIIQGEILIGPALCSNMILKLVPLASITVTNILQSAELTLVFRKGVTQFPLFLAQAVHSTKLHQPCTP